MSTLHTVATLRRLRNEPVWRLLAADKAVPVVALLRALLEADKSVPASLLYERLARALDELRADGEDLPQSPQAYVADWLAAGWLARRLPAGAPEEQFELSADGASALRIVASLTRRRQVATESRLSVVIQAVLKLTEETDPNTETRIAALLAERARIDREIEAVQRGDAVVLPEARALERAREIIALSDELAGDFRRVRDDFEGLNRGLRQSLMEREGSRGEVLEALFAGVDVIGDSPSGQTFAAFWRLLTDPEQSQAVRNALDTLTRRQFAAQLESRERRFLLNLTYLLSDEGSSVHEVLQSFARSLKSFVQSREFLEQRRLHSLLKLATHAALQARDHVRANQELGYELTLTSSRVRSLSQYQLYDPADQLSDANMLDTESSEIDLASVGELVRQSEIDFRSLRENIRNVLAFRDQASIGQVLDRHPAEQGFGSVIGYVALGVKHAQLTAGSELVQWRGHDLSERRARLPNMYFLRERYDELID